MQSASLTARIDPDLKSRLENMAKAQDRSVSYVTNKALERAVEEHEALISVLEQANQEIEQGYWFTKEQVMERIRNKQWS